MREIQGALTIFFPFAFGAMVENTDYTRGKLHLPLRVKLSSICILA
jgi:phosphate starvation-inducible membrane PsiE